MVRRFVDEYKRQAKKQVDAIRQLQKNKALHVTKGMIKCSCGEEYEGKASKILLETHLKSKHTRDIAKYLVFVEERINALEDRLNRQGG